MSRPTWNSPLDLFARERVRQSDTVAREELQHDIARVGFDRRDLRLSGPVPAPSTDMRYRLAASPAIVRRAVRLLAPFVPRPVGRIAVEEGSGLVLAAALSVHLGIPLAVVRRGDAAVSMEHGVVSRSARPPTTTIEGGLRAADTVCAIHDVVVASDDVLALVRRLRSVGADVLGTVALLNFAGDVASTLHDEELTLHALFDGPDFAPRGDNR